MDPRIEKIFFGTKLDRSFDQTVITNIMPVYRGIVLACAAGRASRVCRGIYENVRLRFRGLRFRLVRITPGNAVVDVIKLLKGRVSGVHIVGIAGALRKDARIGEIVYPAATVTPGAVGSRVVFSGDRGNGIICQTDGLLQTAAFYRSLRSEGADYVDMESFFAASGLKGTGTKFSMAAIVSDLPLSRPFYSAPKRRPNVDYSSILERILGPSSRQSLL
ncbi:MAG: hypothetical protein HY796_05265 [Elusimicrobia bacterium]|nr:hypothetical protein [Elusimicrobiota bacterium]